MNDRSDCHEWSSLQIYEYTAEVAGLRPVKPGWDAIEFRPRVKLYESAYAKIATGKKGVAEVSWKTVDGKVQVNLKLPTAVNVESYSPDGRRVDHGLVDHLVLTFGI